MTTTLQQRPAPPDSPPPAIPARRKVRRTPLTWYRGGGLWNLLFLLPMIFVFFFFSWSPIVQSAIMSFQKTNLIVSEWVGFDNYVTVLTDPELGRAVINTIYFALLALLFGFPLPLFMAVLMSEVRRGKGLYSALAYLPGRHPAGRRGAAVEVLLQRRPERRLQHRARLVRHPAAAVDPVDGAGDAVARARGDLGGGRRIDHHLPRRAAVGAAGAVRRGRGRRRRHLAQGLARHDPAAARHPLHHADPAGHRDRAGVPRAVPVHRRRSGRRDEDDPAVHLRQGVPQQPRRRLRRGHRGVGAARDRARASCPGCTSSSPTAGARQ